MVAPSYTVTSSDQTFYYYRRHRENVLFGRQILDSVWAVLIASDCSSDDDIFVRALSPSKKSFPRHHCLGIKSHLHILEVLWPADLYAKTYCGISSVYI